MGQGIYVDPARDSCGMYFGSAPNPDEISGVDHSPGYLRTAAKYFAGQLFSAVGVRSAVAVAPDPNLEVSTMRSWGDVDVVRRNRLSR